MACRSIDTLRTAKYMASADHLPFPLSRLPSHNVSTASQVGCAQITSNSMLVQDGQHPLTEQRAANFMLLANQ